MKSKMVWVGLAWSALQLSCDIPKDPNDSYKDAKTHGLKIGVVNVEDTEIQRHLLLQKEIELLRGFAEKHQLSTKETKGTESELLGLLEDGQLQMVVGGFDEKTVWKEKAALSKPYDSTHVVALPKGENALIFAFESYILNNND